MRWPFLLFFPQFLSLGCSHLLQSAAKGLRTATAGNPSRLSSSCDCWCPLLPRDWCCAPGLWPQVVVWIIPRNKHCWMEKAFMWSSTPLGQHWLPSVIVVCYSLHWLPVKYEFVFNVSALISSILKEFGRAGWGSASLMGGMSWNSCFPQKLWRRHFRGWWWKWWGEGGLGVFRDVLVPRWVG